MQPYKQEYFQPASYPLNSLQRDGDLTNMLNLLLLPISLTKISLQQPPKHLEQHLKARLGDSRVISALAQLITDKGVLSPRELVEAEADSGLAQLEANQVASCVWNMGVLDAKDHGYLSFDVGQFIKGMTAG